MFKGKHTEETKNKIRESIKKKYVDGVNMGFRSQKGMRIAKKSNDGYWKGKKLSYDIWNKGISGQEYSDHYKNGFGGVKNAGRTGELSPGWKGGITPLRQKIKSTKEWKNWIKEIMERDGYKCVLCGYQGNDLHVDHIKPYSLIRKQNNITSVDEAVLCDELWDIDNGRVLCIECHKKTPTYLSGAFGIMHEENRGVDNSLPKQK